MTDSELIFTMVALVGVYLSLVYCFLIVAQQARSGKQAD